MDLSCSLLLRRSPFFHILCVVRVVCGPRCHDEHCIMDHDAIASVVKAEIERQQAAVDYNALSVEELEKVVQHLQSRLELSKAVIAKRAATVGTEVGAVANANAEASDASPAAEGDEPPPKKDAPKLVAKKAEGNWPELPWGGE